MNVQFDQVFYFKKSKKYFSDEITWDKLKVNYNIKFD